MASKTGNKGLWQLSDNVPNWHHYVNCNVDTMNATIFKLAALHDVALEAFQDKSILKWDTRQLKWVVAFSRET